MCTTFHKEINPQGCLRVALISDSHGIVDERILTLVSHCDAVVHAGDIGSHSLLASLKPRMALICAVRGNNDTPDKWPPQDREFLDTLPWQTALSLPGGKLYIVHGDRFNPVKKRHEKLRRTFADAKAIVYGHSHRLSVDDSSIPWVLNPGAAGRTRTYGGPSFIVLTVNNNSWKLETHRFPKLKNTEH
jgi:putative phosphoesterase